MCSKWITFFAAALCLSLCVLPCSASDYEISPDVVDLAQSGDLDLIVPYSSGSSWSISAGTQKASITFVDTLNNKVTLKNVPVSSYTWNTSGGGYVSDAVSEIDFSSLAGDTTAIQNILSQINSKLTSDASSVAYWTRQIQLLTAQIQGYLQAGIPSLDGHLFDSSGQSWIYFYDPWNPSIQHIPLDNSNLGLFFAYSVSEQAYTYDLIRNNFSRFSGWLSGSSDFSPSFSFQVVDSYDENGNPVMKTENYTSLASFLSGLGTSLETPLKMLQDVLATPEDIKLREQEAENKKEFTDNFTGEGEAAAGKDDISDAAGFTSGIKDAFGGNTVSAGDVFKPMTDEDTFAFFSQQTHDALDTTGGVSAQSDDDAAFWDQFEADEDGFLHLKDKSAWSISDYLKGGE